MKSKIKQMIEDGLIKGLIATLIFTIVYTFAFSMITRSNTPLIFLADHGFVHTYLIVSMIVGALPYILCGYLMMLARNKRNHLRRKNRDLALAIFVLSFIFYLGITLFQFIFAYRNINELYIYSNYTLLRSTQYLQLNMLQINMMMLLSTALPALFIYIGGELRLKVIMKGEYDG